MTQAVLPSGKRVLSAAQPTGQPHIGNYLGALKQWVVLQDAGNEVFAMVADLHALTVPQDPSTFSETTLRTAALLIGAGIDPARSTLFIQSQVAAHTEAAWLLTTITPVGDLARMTQYKDKSKKSKTVNAGLLTYPILMAADILLYQADLVPVGEDQKQHLEFARALARKFNRQFGRTVKEPRAFLPHTTARIMSLTDPTRKMSKSDPPASSIALWDTPDVIRKKIRSAVTDSGTEVHPAKIGAALRNLLTIFSACTSEDVRMLADRFSGKGYAVVKDALTTVVIETLTPVRTKAEAVYADQGQLRALLAQGAKRATAVANKTLAHMHECMGIVSLI